MTIRSLDDFYDKVKKRYIDAGQDHTLSYYDDLSLSEKESLLKELDSIDVEKLSSFLLQAAASSCTSSGDSVNIFEPFDGPVESTDSSGVDDWQKLGIEAIGKSQVCALVLAGGQGTRLGFEGPKGMYKLKMSYKGNEKSLFQLVSERILKLQLLTSGVVPFYIMTSPMNHDITKKYFQDNNYFGLQAENVILFPQGVLPCTDMDGKIIMQTKSKVFMAPDGNGGIYSSMQNEGIIDDLTKRDIRYIHAFAIDNALVRPCDPVFIGYCLANQADCGNKVVWKKSAHEKVGIMVQNKQNKKPYIVEYSDLDKSVMELMDEKTGKLQYGAGNICNHFYTLTFLKEKVLPNLSDIYHIAKKKIVPYIKDGSVVEEVLEPNGNKLESFIFDVFPLSEKMAILDVNREQEFAPVKNAVSNPSKGDSPLEAMKQLSDLAKLWAHRAEGVDLIEGETDEELLCEISPLTSYGGEGILEHLQKKSLSALKCPFQL